MSTQSAEKPLTQQIRENQQEVVRLTNSMSLWLGTPYAQKPEVRAKIKEIQDRTYFRIQQLELEGQRIKIAGAQAVINLLKTGK